MLADGNPHSVSKEQGFCPGPPQGCPSRAISPTVPVCLPWRCVIRNSFVDHHLG